MIRTVRAAGFAVAAVALCATATLAHASMDRDPMDQTAAVAPASPQGGMVSLLARHALSMIGQGADNVPQAAPRSLTLAELVQSNAATDVPDAEQECLAAAVYFEARGEPVEGQLAVAEVVLNRAASGKYPETICAVVTQPWQFSFIQRGQFPRADRSSEAWRKAVAVAHIASADLAQEVPGDVLWYHADYVAPSWGRRLTRETKIGAHIFYS